MNSLNKIKQKQYIYKNYTGKNKLISLKTKSEGKNTQNSSLLSIEQDF